METTKTVRCGNVTVVIHRPVLSNTERAKRENEIKTALAIYGRRTK